MHVFYSCPLPFQKKVVVRLDICSMLYYICSMK
jgi:hypothetical protein